MSGRVANQVGVDEGRRLLWASLTEKQFQSNVVRQARTWGWWVHHQTISYRSGAGLPDLLLIRGDRIVFAELKSMKGRVSPAQQDVIERIRATGKAEAYIWRPDQDEEIAEVLRP